MEKSWSVDFFKTKGKNFKEKNADVQNPIENEENDVPLLLLEKSEEKIKENIYKHVVVYRGMDQNIVYDEPILIPKSVFDFIFDFSTLFVLFRIF